MTKKNETPAKEGGKKKRGMLKRTLTLLLVLVLVLGAVVLTTMEDGSHFASLRRWLMYGDSDGAKDIYAYAVS